MPLALLTELSVLVLDTLNTCHFLFDLDYQDMMEQLLVLFRNHGVQVWFLWFVNSQVQESLRDARLSSSVDMSISLEDRTSKSSNLLSFLNLI